MNRDSDNIDPLTDADAQVPGHLPDEAAPGSEVRPDIPPPPAYGLADASWSEEQWFQMLEALVSSKIVSWKDVCALVLGSLNPPQFGTSLASSDGFKRRYGKGKTMRIVMEWAYAQIGKCADCGSRLELQADHAQPKETFDDPLDADFIENMVFRCRRCNVIRRPTHALGGQTFLTAESALMWILLTLRPRTYEDFVRMCRLYGMTMSDIRMEEAWAMAHWMARENPPRYGIENDPACRYDIWLWGDNAVTRSEAGKIVHSGAQRIHESVEGNSVFGFVAKAGEKVRFHEIEVSQIPFSTYELGNREPQALAIKYISPDRTSGAPQRLEPLPPRNQQLYAHGIRMPEQRFRLESADGKRRIIGRLEPATMSGRKFAAPAEACRLIGEYFREPDRLSLGNQPL